jgi:tetratricopeptide (TPR) repeat protein
VIANKINHLSAAVLLSLIVVGLLGCSAKTPEEQILQAQEYHSRGDFWDCIALCEDIIKTAPPGDPVLIGARMLVADCYRQTGDFPRARSYWNDLIEQHGVAHNAGFQAFQNLIYSLLVEAQITGDPDLLKQAGENALLLIEEKAEELEKTDPWRHELSFIAVRLLAELQRNDEVIATLGSMVDDELTTTALKHRATQTATELLVDQQEFAKAIEFNENALEHFVDTPYLVAIQHVLSQLHQEVGNTEKSLEYQELTIAQFDKLIAETPGAEAKVNYMMQKARVFGQLMRFDDACAVYREALDKYPISAKAMSMDLAIPFTIARKGEYLFDEDEYDAAMAAYDEAIRLYDELGRRNDPEMAQAIFGNIAAVNELKRRTPRPATTDETGQTTTTLGAQPTTTTLQLTTTTLEAQTTSTTLDNRATTTVIDKEALPELPAR